SQPRGRETLVRVVAGRAGGGAFCGTGAAARAAEPAGWVGAAAAAVRAAEPARRVGAAARAAEPEGWVGAAAVAVRAGEPARRVGAAVAVRAGEPARRVVDPVVAAGRAAGGVPPSSDGVRWAGTRTARGRRAAGRGTTVRTGAAVSMFSIWTSRAVRLP
ncbi:MAG: hypothetical protein ACLGIG_06610, partial [Actinomycetes bacterium]